MTVPRNRAARVLAYTVARLDQRDAHRIPAPDAGCPDCSAAAGEWCDPWCGRFREDPE